MGLNVHGAGLGAKPPVRPIVRAGGPEPSEAAPKTPFGLPAELLEGLSYKDGLLHVPADKIKGLLRQYVGNKATADLQDGGVRLHIADGADVWTTLTPQLVDGNGVRLAFSDTRWSWFIFGGRVSPAEARDRALEEISKKVRPPAVDRDDVEEYREKQAEIARWQDRIVRLESLPNAADEDNAEKLEELRKKIARQEQKLAGRDYAKVRASLETKEPTLTERIGGSLRADGNDALRFDLPLPPGFQVSDLQVTADGLAFKVRGPAQAPAMLPASPMLATAARPAPRLESPVSGLPGFCQPIGNIWSLRAG